MAYLRLFVELQSENTGASHGQARIELQDRSGQVDVKVRGALMGLWSGDVYEAALVSERKGHYREHPLGQFIVNGRGQANLMFRGSFSDEAEDGLGVAGFKAFVARSGRKRIIGYRGEYISIPDQYEEVTAEVVQEPAEVEESALPEEIVETAEVEEAEESVPVDSSAVIEEEEDTCQFDEAVLTEEDATPASAEVQKEETVEVQSEATEDTAEEEVMAVSVPVEEATEESDVEPSAEPIASVSAEAEPAAFIAKSLPEPIYVIRDLGEVSELCGNAGARAFQRYHHLIFIEQGHDHLLGMPSRYRPSQYEELAGDGYTEFFTPHGGAPSYGEFGYWMKKV